jgi:hypothetical protein
MKINFEITELMQLLKQAKSLKECCEFKEIYDNARKESESPEIVAENTINTCIEKGVMPYFLLENWEQVRSQLIDEITGNNEMEASSCASPEDSPSSDSGKCNDDITRKLCRTMPSEYITQFFTEFLGAVEKAVRADEEEQPEFDGLPLGGIDWELSELMQLVQYAKSLKEYCEFKDIYDRMCQEADSPEAVVEFTINTCAEEGVMEELMLENTDRAFEFLRAKINRKHNKYEDWLVAIQNGTPEERQEGCNKMVCNLLSPMSPKEVATFLDVPIETVNNIYREACELSGL